MKLTRGKKPEKEKEKSRPQPVQMQIEPARAGGFSDVSPKKPRQEKPAPEPDSEPQAKKQAKPKEKKKEKTIPRPKPAPEPEESAARQSMASSGPLESHIAELKERMDRMESILENVSERLKESSGPGKPGSGASGERVSRLEEAMMAFKERLISMNSRIGDLEQKSQPQEAPAPEMGNEMGGRLDTFDSRITGMTDKLVRLSEDMQKLTSYFMEGIKHVESRMIEMENEKSTKAPEEKPEVTPSSFRSRIKREFNQDSENDVPKRRFNPRFPRLPFPRPPSQDSSGQPPVSSTSNIPPAPAPDRGSVFMKLRDGTVVRRPMPSRDPETHDIEILMEHIRESTQKRESREKIRRDLINAGFDPNLIAKAFMRLRSG